MKMIYKKTIIFICVVFTLSLSVYAMGAVYGIVEDSVSGKPLKAQVKLFMGYTTITKTCKDDGGYIINAPEGTNYALEASFAGYKTIKIEGINIIRYGFRNVPFKLVRLSSLQIERPSLQFERPSVQIGKTSITQQTQRNQLTLMPTVSLSIRTRFPSKLRSNTYYILVWSYSNFIPASVNRMRVNIEILDYNTKKSLGFITKNRLLSLKTFKWKAGRLLRGSLNPGKKYILRLVTSSNIKSNSLVFFLLSSHNRLR